MSRVAKKASKHFAKIQRLTAMGVAGNKERKKMRDVWYSTDGQPTAGQAWNPDGKQHVR